MGSRAESVRAEPERAVRATTERQQTEGQQRTTHHTTPLRPPPSRLPCCCTLVASPFVHLHTSTHHALDDMTLL